MVTRRPPKAAVDNGHDLAEDPPASGARVERWTCRRPDCRAVALRHASGNEYGSATEEPCRG
jgi:hypothetical protein